MYALAILAVARINACRFLGIRTSSVLGSYGRASPRPLQGYLAHKKPPSPLGHCRALGRGLLQGPRGVRFLISEVYLQDHPRGVVCPYLRVIRVFQPCPLLPPTKICLGPMLPGLSLPYLEGPLCVPTVLPAASSYGLVVMHSSRNPFVVRCGVGPAPRALARVALGGGALFMSEVPL